jgi:DNA polymerase III subunit epsilon
MFALWRKFTAQQTWRSLLDAKLLAAVYGEPTRTRQAVPQLERITAGPSNIRAIVRPRPLPPRVTTDDRNARREFVRTLGRDAVWLKPLGPNGALLISSASEIIIDTGHT